MQQRSFGYFDIENSNYNESWLSPVQPNNRDKKKIQRLLTADFNHYDKVDFKSIKESIQDEFRPQTLKEMVNQTKLKFIETTPNSIIRRQEKQSVPFYIKQRDDQIKKVKSFKPLAKEQNDNDDDANKKVCIFLIEAFFIIFLIIFATELFLRKYQQ